MKSNHAKTLLIASFCAMSMAAQAQYGSPSAPPGKTGATTSAAEQRLSESDMHAFKEGRRACSKMTGAERESCRKQLSAKYVDKQCRNLTGTQLEDCLRTTYPGE